MIWQFHPFLDGQTGRRHRRLAAVVADFPPRIAVAHALQALQLQPVKYRHLKHNNIRLVNMTQLMQLMCQSSVVVSVSHNRELDRNCN